MIVVKVDDKGLVKQAAKELGEFGDKAPQVVVSALNDTGKNVGSMLKKYIRQTYTYSRSDKLKQAFNDPTKATKTNMDYRINVTSDAPHLTDFKTTPTEPTMGANHMAAKVKVLKKGSMKDIGTDPLKAFIARFSSGKVAVVQRVPGARYTTGKATREEKWGKGADMTKLKAFFGPKITSMAGKMYTDKDVQDEIDGLLQKNLKKHIDKVIQRMNNKK